MEFQEVLVRERKARGLSQEDLAARVRVSRQAVSKWETGDALPDFPRLLVLAETLDLSLDTLCGRSPSTPAPQSADTSAKGRVWPALCGLLAVCLALCGLWLWRIQSAEPTERTLPDLLAVSGIAFSPKSAYALAFRFVPSAADTNSVYQITFTDQANQSKTFDASLAGGVCTGTAYLQELYGSYSVTASMGDGSSTRNIAIATDLTFTDHSVSWMPVE